MEPDRVPEPPSVDSDGGEPRRRPGGARRRIALSVLILAVLGSGLAVAARAATAPTAPSRPMIAGGAPNASRVSLPKTGMVVVLRRPGLTELPAQTGRESPVLVTVDSGAPLAAVELWAGGELVDRVVPDDERTGRTDTFAFVPAAPGVVTLVARAADRDGRWGQSNPLRLEVIDPVPLAGVLTIKTMEGETLEAAARRVGADPDLVASLNPGEPRGPEEVLTTGTELGVPVALDDLPPPPAGEGAGPSGDSGEIESQGAIGATRARVLPPLPAGPDLGVGPELVVTMDDCTLTATTTAAEEQSGMTLVQAPPSGGSFYPVFDFGPASAGASSSTKVPLSTGVNTFTVAAAQDGVVTSWSDLVELVAPDHCDGWTGTVKLSLGQLLTKSGQVPDADSAYLYLSTELDEWIRVPAVGFVPRTELGFNFAPYLPPLQGHDLALAAWGRKDGALVDLGSGQLLLDPSVSLDTVLPSPKVQLHWIENFGEKDKYGYPKPEKLVTEGKVNKPKSLVFRWDTSMAGITHVVWQVTALSVPPSAGPYGGNVLLQGTVPAGKDYFSIDFAPLVGDVWFDEPAPSHLYAPGPGGTTSASLDGAGAYALVQLGADVAGVTTATASPVNPIPDLYNDPSEYNVDGHYVVRAVPFAGDSYVGAVSNDVTLTTTDEPVYPKAPTGQPDHALDVELLDEPRPPNPVKTACWQIAGYADEAAYKAKLAAVQANANNDFPLAWASNQYTFWDWMWKQLGSNPICAGCYTFGSTKVGLAGASCSSSSVLGDLFKAFKSFVDMVAEGFSFLKSIVVDAVATLSGCKAVSSAAGGGSTGESICNTLAEAVVNAALISLGIPPTLPNFDQLMAAAKGEIVELAAALAAQAGVPCDDAEFAAEVHGEKKLTCEGAVEALIDEVAAQLNKAYVDAATAMGFNFPPELRVVPHPDGQVKPATVRLTVKPTKFSAAVQGQACTAMVLTGSTWVAKNDPAGVLLFGKPPFPGAVVKDLYPGWGYGTSYHELSTAFWSNGTFEAAYLKLPNLPKTSTFGDATYGEASRTYQLYPPLSLPGADIAGLTQTTYGTGDNQKSQVHKSWGTVPRQVMLLNKGAKLQLTALSSCAGSTSRQYLMHGFTFPSAKPLEVPG